MWVYTYMNLFIHAYSSTQIFQYSNTFIVHVLLYLNTLILLQNYIVCSHRR